MTEQLNTFDDLERTAFFAACDSGDLSAVIEFLQKNGAERLKEWDSIRAVSSVNVAASSGHSAVLECLLESGMDVNAAGVAGYRAIHTAVVNKQKECLKILIRYHADINSRLETGRTPLMIAATHGLLEMAELLLENGADIILRDKQGRDALQWAKDNEQRKMIQFLSQWPEKQRLKREADVEKAIAENRIQKLKTLKPAKHPFKL